MPPGSAFAGGDQEGGGPRVAVRVVEVQPRGDAQVGTGEVGAPAVGVEVPSSDGVGCGRA